ncbi:MAG: NFACT RNA binding domain-containing protein [Vulcanimicrobiaceae bacterium]
MLTDWLIVRRLAAELERELRGARVRSAGMLAGGRFGLRVPRGTLALDPFGPTPLLTLEPELPLERAAGWPRAFADVLEGLRIERVRGRHGDRLIAIDLAARSRFGVASRYRLVVELTPRFGNLVLLKDDGVIAAAKEFPRGSAGRRATVVGEEYEPPPLPSPPAETDPLEAFAALAAGELGARERAIRALRGAVPLLPRLPAESFVAEAAELGTGSAALASRVVERARALVEASDGEPGTLGDVFVYGGGGQVVQVHVIPLLQFSALEVRRERALLPLLGGLLDAQGRARAAQAFAARRGSLRTRVERRVGALATERSALQRERADVQSTEALRNAGDLLYAHLAEVPAGATSFAPPSQPEMRIELDPALDAKANAAAIFKRYKKAVGRRRHLEQRLAQLEGESAYGEELLWELERAEPETLDDLAEAVDRLERRKAGTRGGAATRPARDEGRAALEFPLAGDARVYVGRSPRNNAELTFRVARPNDLWFHARATPGAHVVLRIDSQRLPSDDELHAAAGLAAYHSKARASEKVAVDYTERKYVRRQQGAPPGLVWYTNARTLLVAPRT